MPLIYFGRRSTRICMRPVSLSKGNSSNFFAPHCVHRMKRISWSSCLRLCQIVLHFLQSDSPSPLERWWITLSASHAVKFSLRERDTVALPNKLCNFFRHFLCAHTFFFINNLFLQIFEMPFYELFWSLFLIRARTGEPIVLLFFGQRLKFANPELQISKISKDSEIRQLKLFQWNDFQWRHHFGGKLPICSREIQREILCVIQRLESANMPGFSSGLAIFTVFHSVDKLRQDFCE